MTKAKTVEWRELAKKFKYEGGKLYRLWESNSLFAGQWKEVNVSKSCHAKGYVWVTFKGKQWPAHRIIYMLVHQVTLGAADQIDHIECKRTDNRPNMLRVTNNRGNSQRRKANREAGKLCGTEKYRKRWRAKIRIGGKSRYLGTFDTAEEAHERYQQVCLCLEAGINII